jgi:hypothetical protein
MAKTAATKRGHVQRTHFTKSDEVLELPNLVDHQNTKIGLLIGLYEKV